MSIVAGSLQLGGGTTAEITAAAAVVPLVRQVIVNRQTGQYYIGDGTTALGSLTAYGGASGLTVGTTTITSGTNTRILYNNNGVLGEYTLTGSGTAVAMGTSPTISTSLTMNGGGTGSVKLQLLTGDANLNAIYINQATPSAINAALTSTNNSTTYLNGQVATQISVATNAVQYYNSFQTHYTGGVFSGTLSGEGVFDITPGTAVNLTAGTEINMFMTKSYTWTWNTGALALQNFNVIKSPTIAFNGASTVTFVSNLSVEHVVKGTNATLTTATAIHVPASAFTSTTNAYSAYLEVPTGATNNWALGLTGDINFNTTTGIVNATTNLLNKAGSTVRTLIGSTTIEYVSAIGLSLKRGAVAAEGYLHIGAGASGSNQCPMKFTTGTNMTTAEAGAMEYNNTFHLTNSDATRRHIVLAPNTTKVIAAAPYANDGYVVVNIGGTDFKFMTTA